MQDAASHTHTSRCHALFFNENVLTLCSGGDIQRPRLYPEAPDAGECPQRTGRPDEPSLRPKGGECSGDTVRPIVSPTRAVALIYRLLCLVIPPAVQSYAE